MLIKSKRLRRVAKLLLALLVLFVALFLGNAYFSDWEKPVVLPPAEAASLEPVDEVRVMTFNIAKCFAYNGGGRFASRQEVTARLDQIAEIIRREQADLVFLQEVIDRCPFCDVNQGAYLAKATGFSYAYGTNYDWGFPKFSFRSGCAVLSRFPLKAHNVEQLPGVTSVISPVGTRRILWCTVTINQKEYRCAPIHNDSFDKDRNKLQADFILKTLDGKPTLLVGDFNATPNSPSMRAFQKSKRFTAMWNGPATFHGNQPHRTLDYLLAPSAWKLKRHKVLPSTVSDHFPVLSVFEVKP